MRVLVCGSRVWGDIGAINRELNALLGVNGGPDNFVVIEGGARGADRTAGEWADNNHTEHLVFSADWDKYGKAAGPIRNKQMLVEGKPDLVLAFQIRESRGTQNMIDQAKAAGVPVKVIKG